MAQVVKHLPAMRETSVRSLGQEDLHNTITIEGFLNYRLKYIYIYIERERERERVFQHVKCSHCSLIDSFSFVRNLNILSFISKGKSVYCSVSYCV